MSPSGKPKLLFKINILKEDLGMETLVKKEDNLLVLTPKKNEVKKEIKTSKSLNSHEINLKMYDYMIF